MHTYHKNKRKGAIIRLISVIMLLIATFPTKASADAVKDPQTGYYMLFEASDLLWFAQQVSAGNDTICGRLYNDIYLSSLEQSYWEPIGSLSVPFKGKFDGKGHTVHGLRLKAKDHCGLFGYAENATIENTIVSSVEMADINVSSINGSIGAVCGTAKNSIIRNCHALNVDLDFAKESASASPSYVGGLCGTLSEESRMVGCTASGIVRSVSDYIGGMAGAVLSAEIDSCSVLVGDSLTSIYAREYAGGITGEVLNRPLASSITHCTVASGVDISSREADKWAIICPYEKLSDELKLYKGAYEIYTPAQLAAFRDKVNSGDTKIAGRLMNNLNMASYGTFSPIGIESNGGYQGVFDGQNNTIDSIRITDQEYAGLFGFISKEGTVVKNLVLNAPSLNTADNDYLGFVVGMATQKASVDNCHVTGGNLLRIAKGEPECVGGIAGKADVGATISHCSFQGIIQAMEIKVGGIVGELNSGAVASSCYIMGPSTVWGDDYVGGIVGEIIDDATTAVDCYANQTAGQVTVHVTSGNTNSGLIWGKNGSKNAGTFTRYNEGGLIYEKTGQIDNDIESVMVTGVSDKSQSLHHVVYDIGTKYDYATDSIQNLQGAKNIDFIDCISNIAGTEACKWIHIGICDGALDSNFEAIYMRYTVYAGADHVMMLRPTDVYPVGDNLFINCPNAKVYIDAEYYADFCADPQWSKYKNHLVSTTSMRKDADFTEDGVKYAYERNHDATGSIVEKKSTNSSSKVQMVQVVGCDDSKIQSNNGVLKVYQDIGETYNYNTTRILNNTFKDNENIKQVVFEEIMSDASDSYYSFGIAIGDSAFKNCTNLEYFDVALSSSKNKKHYTAIHARDLPLGKGVFDGCTNLKIRIPSTMMDEFRTDTTWSQYKDLFVETDFNITAFTEAGVYYSYYTSSDGKKYYTNKDNSEMPAVLTPYISHIRGFSADQVLETNSSHTIYYVYASGVDNDAIKKKDGELRIYNDIGSSSYYKTISVSATAFRNNENIKKIVFEDCASNIENAEYNLSLFIPNGAFQGCKNLKELNLYYLQTDGTNHYYALKPSEVFVGANVFDGVDENFRIIVSPEYYTDFVTDANWSQYAKYIVASEYQPTTKAGKIVEGLTYDYACTSLNTIPTSTLSSLQLSYVHSGARLALLIASSIITAGLSIIDETAIWAWRIANLTSMALNMARLGTLQYQAASVTNDMSSSTTDLQVTVEALVASLGYSYAMMVIPDLFLQIATGAVLDVTSFQVYNSVENAIRYSTSNRLDYLSHRIERACKRATANRSDGLGFYYTQQRTNIPKMYVSHVSDDLETARIYNDIGTYTSDYQTIAVGREAFHNKTKLKTVEFYDRQDSYQSLSSLQLILPDSCFIGCSNLTTVNLVLTSKRSGGKVALTPDNFILSGYSLFAGCDTTKLQILIGRDALEEYQEDPFWSRYASRFVAVDLPSNPVKYTEGNINYGYAYYNNTTPLQSEINDHTVKHLNVVSGNDEKLKSNSGQATLINDIGTTTSYKVDNIEKHAFKGNDNLKEFHFMDTNSYIAQAYADLDLNICDSAFANCKNFKEMYLVYWKTSGSNNSVAISPSSLRLGKGVFDGCDNLRIKIDFSQKAAFLADTCWNKYSDKIVPCLVSPADETVYDLLEKYAYTSPLPDQVTNHLDISSVKPLDLKGTFRFDRNITSFDEFAAFEVCNFDTIYNHMFEMCSNMQSITLPNGVRKICDYVFNSCDALGQITIPKSVNYLGDYVFYQSGIKEIFFESNTPPRLKQDDYHTFASIISKDEAMVYVPDAAVAAYEEAYPHLAWKKKIKGKSTRHGLKVIRVDKHGTLADSLGLIYNYSSSDITLKGPYAQYDSLRIEGLLDGRDIGVLRFLGGRDVENCDPTPGRLKYLDLYNVTISPGEYEYNRAQSLFDKNFFNNKVTSMNCVDKYMFWKLDALETLILPVWTTWIRDKAVADCPNLKTLVVGDSVRYMADNIIYNDLSLNFVVMQGKNVPSTTSETFSRNGSPIKAILVPNGTQADYMGQTGFYNGTDTITYLFVDESLRTVMRNHHIYTPYDLLTVTDITRWLNGCTDIKTFDELYYTNILALRDSTFVDMSSLEQITLPSNLLAITSGAFKNCPNLRTIWAIGNFIPALDTDAFETINPDFVVYVSADQAEKYRKAWPQYASHIRVAGISSNTDNLIEVTLTEPNTLADALGLRVTTEDGVFEEKTAEHAKGEKCVFVRSVAGDYSNIKALKVNGPISGEDIAVLRVLGGRSPGENSRVYLSQLEYLDLYDADIVAGDEKVVYTQLPKVFGYYMELGHEQYVREDNKIPRMTFRALDNIKTLILPRSAVELGYEACYDMFSLKKLVVGDDMTFIDNDALGECNNLKSIIMLSKTKPKLDGDAFTDPTFEGDVLKVDHFYVPKELSVQYAEDTEYTSHASDISTAFDDDKTFRTFGRHAIINTDELSQVSTFKHLFKRHCEDVTDLSLLSCTKADSVNVGDFSNMPSLQRLALPSTISTIATDAFANNKALHWLDMSACDSLQTYTANQGVSNKAIVYVPKTINHSDLDNVVYTDGNDLKCAKYNLTATHNYDVPKAFTAQAVTFDGTFNPDSIATLTLPFSCHIPEGLRAYQLEDGYYNEIHFGQVDTILVNQPYIIKVGDDYTGHFSIDTTTVIEATPLRLPQVDGAGYTSFGALSSTTAASASAQKLLVMNGQARWNLVSATDTIGIQPFTSYLQIKNNEAPTTNVVTYFDDFFTPKIQLFEGNDNTDTIDCYNLQRVDASLSRTLVADAWNTFCVPFDVKVSNSPLKDATVLGIKEINGNCISFKQVEYIRAGQAYLVKPTTNIVNPSFDYVRIYSIYPQYAGGYDYVGIYSPMTIDNTRTVYFLGGDGKLKLAKEGSVMKGLRAYFKVPSEGDAKLTIQLDDSDVTVIEATENHSTVTAASAIYSVDGVYMGTDLKALPKGVYIINGKKVIK